MQQAHIGIAEPARRATMTASTEASSLLYVLFVLVQCLSNGAELSCQVQVCTGTCA
jgi:hypothetical protein